MRSTVSMLLCRYRTLQALLEQVVGEVLGHLLGERGDQHAVALVDAAVDLVDEVVDLALGRAGP